MKTVFSFLIMAMVASSVQGQNIVVTPIPIDAYGKPAFDAVKGIKDQNLKPQQRVMAAYALGRLAGNAGPGSSKAIMEALQDSDSGVRWMAAWALKRVDPVAAYNAGIR